MGLAGCTGSSSARKDSVSISPKNGARDTTVHVTINADNIVAGTKLETVGTGITLAHVEVTPTYTDEAGDLVGGTISADFIIAPTADLGKHAITIVRPNAAGNSTAEFTVLPLGSALPTLVELTPSHGLRGQTVPVILRGTNFMAGDVVAITGGGITVTTDSVTSSTIHATFVIDVNASTVPRNVTVANTSGLVSNAATFWVDLPNAGASFGSFVFAANLDTFPEGPTNPSSSIYISGLNPPYSNLTHSSTFIKTDVHPRLSPDRTAIVFTRIDNNTGGGSSVYLMDFDGTNVRKVTPVGDHGESFGSYSNWPSFHPDGRHILFTNGSEFSRIAIMDLDGSHARFIFPAANAHFDITGPLYSPVGLKIVFSSTQDGPAHIFVMNDDGTNLQRLTNSSDGDRHPTYSYPPGEFIAYERDHYDASGHSEKNIYMMNSDGSNNIALTTDGKSFDPGYVRTNSVTGYIFVSNRSGTDEIYTMDVHGSNTTRLTTLNLPGANLSDPSSDPNSHP